MHNKAPWRLLITGLVLSLALSTLAVGCNLMGPRNQPQTRPSPTRPMTKRTRTPMQPAPTKKMPGLSATGTSALRAAVDKVQAAMDRKDWAAATRETNQLGMVWTRFKPGAGTMSAAEMRNFDANYVKLQRDVRAKNMGSARRSSQALLDTIAKMK